MLRQSTIFIPLALLSAGLLAACQPVHSRGTTRSPVLTQDVRPGTGLYRTSDGQVFNTRAQRDAYLRRQAEIRAQQIYDEELRREQAVRSTRRDRVRAQREAERIAAERARIRAEEDARYRAQREAEIRAAEARRERETRREARRAQEERARRQAIRDAREREDLAEAERLRAERRAQRQARRNAETVAERRRREAIARQVASRVETDSLGRYYRPRFVFNPDHHSWDRNQQRAHFFIRNRRGKESEADFWARPVL